MAQRQPINAQVAEADEVINGSERLLASTMDLLRRLPHEIHEAEAQIAASLVAIDMSSQRLQRL